MKRLLFTTLLGLLFHFPGSHSLLYAQPGTLDKEFNKLTAKGFNGRITALLVQPDGKSILGGYFTKFNDSTYNRIVRLNINGSVDTLFKTGAGLGSEGVTAMALQPDGKIIAGGPFGFYNGIPRKNLVRLNGDGTIDGTFNSAFNRPWLAIYAITLQPDGKILIGTTPDLNEKGISRLNSDGSLDTTFNYGGTGISGDYVYTIALQQDGKIVVGGDFKTYNGNTSANLVRLNKDGTFDNTFNTGTGFNAFVQVLRIQSDGKIVAGGNFTTYNGMAQSHLVRINSNGSTDVSFNIGTGLNATPGNYGLEVQPDGKIVLCGEFASINGVPCGGIARINTDGSLDPNFKTNSGTGFKGTYSWDNPATLALQTDGKVLVGGNFKYFNDTAISAGIARLNGAPLGISSLAPRPAYCPGSDFDIQFVASGQTFSTGNVFTAQLSDRNGSFATPIAIGTLNGTQIGVIKAQIPLATALGSGYRTRVISSNPVLTGIDNGVDIMLAGAPVVGAHASSTDVCAGNTVILTGSGAGAYIWDKGVDDGVSFMPAATTTYTVTGSNGNCSSTSQVTVTVYALPQVTAKASATTVCAGTTVTLTGSGATNYTWNNGVTNGIAFIPTATTDYEVIGTDAHCSDTDRVTITVQLPPTVTAKASVTSVCSGGSVTLSGGGAQSYSWDNNVMDGVAFTPEATITYTVTGTEGICTDTAQVQIAVRGTPLILTDTFCKGQVYTLGNQAITDSGTYTETYPLSGGCDSVVTLHLWQRKIDVSVTQSERTLTANTQGATYQWIDCNKGNASIVGGSQQNFSSNIDGSYAVIVQKDGCSDTSACYSIKTTSIVEIKTGLSLVAYPNPSKGVVYLRNSVPFVNTTIQVTNTLGQLLMQQVIPSGNSFQINLSPYPAGLYILETKSESGSNRLKITKE